MNSPTQVLLDTAMQSRRKSNHLGLRAFCWTVALALGATQAWATRFTMDPDGVSYLDIGDAYWRHDWHNAINAYWSPLYSWILGLFINVIKPSPYWEYPLVHMVNVAVYVVALGSFEFLLTTIITEVHQHTFHTERVIIPEPELRLLGYSIFLSSALVLIGLNTVTPDLLTSAFIFLAAALALKVRRTDSKQKTAVALGLVLGFAYLSKTVMFPLAAVFLFCAVFTTRNTRRAAVLGCMGTLMFLVVAAPFISAISIQKRRFTFGDSGKINYDIEVQKNSRFIPSASVSHPVEKLRALPDVYEFAAPVSGTYPLWYDPSYWHDGATIHFNWNRQLQAVFRALYLYWVICSAAFFQLNIAVAALAFVAVSKKHMVQRWMALWPLWTPALAALLLYALVVVELRYVAAFLLLGWMTVFAASNTYSVGRKREFMTALCTLVGVSVVLQSLLWTYTLRQSNSSKAADTAILLRKQGLLPGDRIAVMAPSPEGSDGAFFARLARVRIVAEAHSNATTWTSEPKITSQYAHVLAPLGIRAIIVDNPQRVGGLGGQSAVEAYSVVMVGKVKN